MAVPPLGGQGAEYAQKRVHTIFEAWFGEGWRTIIQRGSSNALLYSSLSVAGNSTLRSLWDLSTKA